MTVITGYLDPGSGSLIVQLLVGGLSGLVVLARYVWKQYVIRKRVELSAPSSSEIPIHPPH